MSASMHSSGPEQEKPGEGRTSTEKRDGAAWAELGKRVSEVVDRGLNTMESVLDRTADKINAAWDAGEKALSAAPQMVRDEIGGLLEWMAADPERGRSMVGELVRAAPGVGAAKAYADAWKAYHQGVEQKNDALMEKGRADCVRACLAAAVDAVAFTGAAVVRSAAPLKAFLATASMMHLVSMLPTVDQHIIDPAVTAALKREDVRRMIDGILQAITPPEPAGESAAPEVS